MKFLIKLSLLFFVSLGVYFFVPYMLFCTLKVTNLIASPFLRVRSKVYDFMVLNNSISSLELENLDLKSEIIRLKSIYGYAESIKDVVNFAARYNDLSGVTCQIVQKNLDSESHVITLDKGYKDGVQEGQSVIYKNFLVGRIIEVSRLFSKCLLITDNNCRVSSYCLDSGSFGISEGLRNLDFLNLSFVNHLDSVLEGEMVVSSGEGVVFPRGFGIGKIREFYKEGLFYKIKLDPLVDFKDLKYCFVITNFL